MFSEGKNADFRCGTCSTIKIVWANFGVIRLKRYPLVISSSIENCVTTTATSVVRRKCDGKTECSFAVRDADFLQTNCEKHNTFLLVRYTCKGKVQGVVTSFSAMMREAHAHLVRFVFEILAVTIVAPSC